jgi:hypothetical protein
LATTIAPDLTQPAARHLTLREIAIDRCHGYIRHPD